MINFEEELKRFTPSQEIEDAENEIYEHDITDMTDIMQQMMGELKRMKYRWNVIIVELYLVRKRPAPAAGLICASIVKWLKYQDCYIVRHLQRHRRETCREQTKT